MQYKLTLILHCIQDIADKLNGSITYIVRLLKIKIKMTLKWRNCSSLLVSLDEVKRYFAAI